VEEGVNQLPDPICFLKYDERKASGEKLVDSISDTDITFYTEEASLSNAWPVSPIDSYALQCRTGTSGGISRWRSYDPRFYIDGDTSDKPFTLTVWVRPTNISNDFRIACIYTESNSGAYYAQWQAMIESSGPSMYIYDGAQSTSVGFIRHRSNAGMTLNIWTHLAFSYSGNRSHLGLRIYKNAVEKIGTREEYRTFTKVRPTTAPLRSCTYLSSNYYYGLGRTDHFRFYDYELTPEQVLLDYQLNPHP
jgi:hypothetical protein